MGREIKRVPLDFKHEGAWPGYLRSCGNKDCEDDQCEGCKSIDPPTGDGWQVWETVSEGSPVSPVFPTAAALVDWLVSQGYSRAGAEAFVVEGWASSMAVFAGRVYRDIDSCAIMKEAAAPALK